MYSAISICLIRDEETPFLRLLWRNVQASDIFMANPSLRTVHTSNPDWSVRPAHPPRLAITHAVHRFCFLIYMKADKLVDLQTANVNIEKKCTEMPQNLFCSFIVSFSPYFTQETRTSNHTWYREWNPRKRNNHYIAIKIGCQRSAQTEHWFGNAEVSHNDWTRIFWMPIL